MNTIIAPTQAAVNKEYSLLAAWEQFKFGYDLFTAGHDVCLCRNIQQRRGWFSALESEAAATLPSNCADRLGF